MIASPLQRRQYLSNFDCLLGFRRELQTRSVGNPVGGIKRVINERDRDPLWESIKEMDNDCDSDLPLPR